MFAIYTASKMSNYGVFTVLSPNAGKYRLKKFVLCTCHAMFRTNRGYSFYIALNGRLGIFS